MRMLSSPSRVSTRAYRTAERCVVANAAAERELAPLLRAAILAVLLKEGDGSAEGVALVLAARCLLLLLLRAAAPARGSGCQRRLPRRSLAWLA